MLLWYPLQCSCTGNSWPFEVPRVCGQWRRIGRGGRGVRGGGGGGAFWWIPLVFGPPKFSFVLKVCKCVLKILLPPHRKTSSYATAGQCLFWSHWELRARSSIGSLLLLLYGIVRGVVLPAPALNSTILHLLHHTAT